MFFLIKCPGFLFHTFYWFFFDMLVCRTWTASFLFRFWYQSVAYWQTLGRFATTGVGQGTSRVFWLSFDGSSFWSVPIRKPSSILRFSDMERIMANQLTATLKSILTFCNQWLGKLSSRNSALILHLIIRNLYKRQLWLWMMWLFVCQRLVLLTFLFCLLFLVHVELISSLFWLFHLLWHVTCAEWL